MTEALDHGGPVRGVADRDVSDRYGGTQSCGCCAGITPRTPLVIENRPGLPEISYRSGGHGDFLDSMVSALSDPDHPALAALRTRSLDDPTIALLDAFAVACDVLTFYTERLAQEAYLRTAAERISLQELGKLLAYRLAPGVAAETWLAFALEHPTPEPPGLPKDPGLAPPVVPQAVVLPERLRVQSVPGADERPQTFETVEEISARPEWNVLPVVATRPHPPTFGRRDAWLAGTGLNLHVGDPILFAGQDLVADRWDVRLITAVDLDRPGDRTHVRWEWGLGSFRPANRPADAPDAFVLRKRIAVFGHNAPVWLAMNASFRAGYVRQFTPMPSKDVSDWPDFGSLRADLTIDLDGAHPDVVLGSWVVVSAEGGTFYRELYRVTRRAELSRSAYGVSGKVTRLTLAGEPHDFGSPRLVTVLAVADPVTLAEAPDDAPVSTAVVDVAGDAGDFAAGRSVILAGRAGGAPHAEVLTIRRSVGRPAGRTELEFTAGPTVAYERASAVVFGNVARATHGESVRQILGSGDARKPFPAYPLRQLPLTFVPADGVDASASINASGAESTLEVQVDGLLWTERPSTCGAAATERVFTTRDEPDGTTAVVFGDGVHGLRPSSGSNNIRSTYRTGLGAAGNVRRDQLSQALDRPLGLKAVTNPLPATGGIDPEPEAGARRSIPRPVRTLGRAVSLLDYADFASAFRGVDKAVAVVLPLREGRSIVVSVASDDGYPPAATTIGRLESAVRRAGDPHVRVRVVPARRATFEIGLRVKVDPDRDSGVVLAVVESRLRSAFGPPAAELGAPVFASQLIAAAASVVGVVAIDLDALHRSAAPRSLQTRLVAGAAGVTATGAPIGAELLGLSAGPVASLTEMP